MAENLGCGTGYDKYKWSKIGFRSVQYVSQTKVLTCCVKQTPGPPVGLRNQKHVLQENLHSTEHVIEI